MCDSIETTSVSNSVKRRHGGVRCRRSLVRIPLEPPCRDLGQVLYL